MNRENLSDETVKYIAGRVGIIGLRMMEIGFLEKDVDDSRNTDWPDDLNSLDGLREWIHNLMEQEQSELLERASP